MTRSPLRWIFHLVAGDAVNIRARLHESSRFAPASLRTEGFLHGSFRDAVAESARLHFPAGVVEQAAAAHSGAQTGVWVVPIDPRRVDVPIELAATPRGPMPHIRGSLPRDALGTLFALGELPAAPDLVDGTRLALVTHVTSSPALTAALRGLRSYATCEVVVPASTEAKPADFDALVVVDPNARAWASGLPRSRRVFTWGDRAPAQVQEWLSLPPLPAAT